MNGPVFRGGRSLGLRLWHWSNSLVVLALVATAFLRDNLVGVREHADAIDGMFADAMMDAPNGLSRDIARLYLDRLWDWHVKLGVVLFLLLVGRVLVEFAAPKGQGLVGKIRAALAKPKDPNARMFAAVKLSHALFYAGLAAIVVTGLILAYGERFGFPKSLHGPVHEAHEFLMYAIVAFVVAHVVGVVRAEKTTDPGLVSDMIHGG